LHSVQPGELRQGPGGSKTGRRFSGCQQHQGRGRQTRSWLTGRCCVL